MSSKIALRVGSAVPDPPFELLRDGAVTGLDPSMMQSVGRLLGLEIEFVRYVGGDFDGIFAGLDDGSYDVVASGATVTEYRSTFAHFCRHYVTSGQSLVVATHRDPPIDSTDDLHGCVLGVQRGNTSAPVARKFEQAGRVAEVREYDYTSIMTALDDVVSGRIDGFMKLEPVMRWLIRDRPALRVAQTGITHERLAIAVRLGNDALAAQLDQALDRLRADGTLSSLGRKWMGIGDGITGTQVVV